MKFTKQATIIAITTAVTVALAAGAVGYRIAQSVDESQGSQGQQTSNPTTEPEQSERAENSTEEPQGEGIITGPLTYPSEGIPSEIAIHAYNIDTQEDFFVKDHVQDSRFKYGIGYRMSVPAGRYHVYGVYEKAFSDQRAYFDEYIKCQLADSGADCTDYSKIVVTVEAGEEYVDAIVGNWYRTCVIPGGEQPTEKFDLPAC